MAGAWTEQEQKTLIALIDAGVSAQRIAVRMKRPLQTIKNRAREIGRRFPNERDLKKLRSAMLNPPE